MQFTKKENLFLKLFFLGGVFETNTQLLEKDPNKTLFYFTQTTRGKTNFFGETITIWNHPFVSFVSA